MFGLQARFFMIFDWKISWFVMSQPLKNTVNIVVFIRFHFFDFFMNLMISGTCLDLILDTFGGLGRPIWWFLGYWRLLEILMNFRVSPEPPQAEGTRMLEGKLLIRGVQYTSNNTRLLTCRTSNTRLLTCWWNIERNWRLSDCKSLASQPGGPWQAGAGGSMFWFWKSRKWLYKRRKNSRRSRPPSAADFLCCFGVLNTVNSWKSKIKSTHIEYI